MTTDTEPVTVRYRTNAPAVVGGPVGEPHPRRPGYRCAGVTVTAEGGGMYLVEERFEEQRG